MNQLNLKQLATPYTVDGELHPYFRPYTSNGSRESYKVFLVGTNPATVIDEEKMHIDDFVDMLTASDSERLSYEQVREQMGKSKLSRTRLGLQSFVTEIEEKTNSGVIITNVLPYPTVNLKKLRGVSAEVLERAREIFKEVLYHFKPNVLVVHGKRSLDELLEALKDDHNVEVISDHSHLSIRELENRGPLLKIKYDDGQEGYVFPCRHFMYYGKTGNSFSALKEKVFEVLDKGENGKWRC